MSSPGPVFATLALAAAAMVAAILPGAAAGHSHRERPLAEIQPIRWAYYYPADSLAMESLRANISRLDVIAPHWLQIDEEGLVRSQAPPAAVELLRTTRALVLPSVALTSREAGRRIVTDPEVGATAVQQLLAAAASWDGLALDFEGLDPSTRDELTRFIGALGAALREAGKYYAIALPAKTDDARTGWSGAYDYAAIATAADLYLVMAYGFRTSASRLPGSTSPLAWVDASMAYAASQIPPERLILGIAFYGYDWNLDRGPPARALRYSDTWRLLKRTGATPFLELRSMSATFRYEVDGEQHEVWFEDAQSIGAKLRLVAKYGLAGAGAWRLGQEDPNAWPVWDALLAGRSTGNVGWPSPRR